MMAQMICLCGVNISHIFFLFKVKFLDLTPYAMMHLYSGFVGEIDKKDETKLYLFTHSNILVQYNGERVRNLSILYKFLLYCFIITLYDSNIVFLLQIIQVNLTQESPKLVEVGKTLDMTYSVKWMLTDVAFARRFDVYLDHPFFEHQVLFPLGFLAYFV